MNSTTLEKVRVYRMSTPEHECPWGLKAVNLLNEKGIDFEDHKLTSREEIDEFKAKHHVETTPQIFSGDERIGGYTDLAEKLDVEAEGADYSYTPVIAIFSSAGLMALATTMGLTGFMGFSLSLLATLKLMDIESFAEGFEKYDLITKRIKPYAKVYPFAELAIALGFLSGVAPLVTGITSLFIGVSGGISVFKAVYIDKLALNCACVGGNSKAPLGIISFAENAIMALMGGALIYSAATGEVESAKIKEIEPAAVVQVQDARR
ncbi:glutaredoxin-like protein [Rivularia sp. PCC 7116]|uniref:MauE/DoxX family redox-associated membrane protein n=1 Tax=Rivularia sp. PCC 7116 TaxID=373994 RepID=UPI00029F0C99|nr:glutaredoxin [Rivularia sp. PCC 7116]AFY54306.1 glutaredoxin-like protein [Rivularia sp. PCC 7116]